MRLPSFKESHFLSQLVEMIKHHRFATILIVIAAGWLIYELNKPAELQELTPQATSPVMMESPLTLLDDPQYSHEHHARAQYIHDCLRALRTETGADRVYVVSYSYRLSSYGTAPEPRIENIFEIVRPGTLPKIHAFKDIPRLGWLHIKSEETSAKALGSSELIPHSYGMELYDNNKNAIGYIGIDFQQDVPNIQGRELEVLSQTAISVEAGLTHPLGRLDEPGGM